MADKRQPPPSCIYLLTIWQEQSWTVASDAGWRFHLTDPQTGERDGFTSPVALLAALRR